MDQSASSGSSALEAQGEILEWKGETLIFLTPANGFGRIVGPWGKLLHGSGAPSFSVFHQSGMPLARDVNIRKPQWTGRLALP